MTLSEVVKTVTKLTNKVPNGRTIASWSGSEYIIVQLGFIDKGWTITFTYSGKIINTDTKSIIKLLKLLDKTPRS